MAGLLGSLNTSSSGMRANQTVIQTINHNISNINTPGYSRQRVELTAANAYSRPGKITSTIGAGQLGQGVNISSVTRVRNVFYDRQLRAEAHSFGSASLKADQYVNIENIFNEMSDTGISASLNNFFNSFSELSKNPTATSTKRYVIESANSLANSINQSVKQLNTLKENLSKEKENALTTVNDILKDLTSLEKDIKIAEATGKNANDLLDKRDTLIDDLSFFININDADVQAALGDGELTEDELDALANPSGTLQGILEMQDEIDSIIDKINVFMENLSTSINNTYNNVATAPNFKNFFVIEKDNNGVQTISVDKTLRDDARLLEMDADKAIALAGLKNQKINIDGDTLSLNTYYTNLLQEIGYKSQQATKEASNRGDFILSIEDSRASESGVSLDEEMISLIQYEHAYSACAKVTATIDSLLDVVINGLIK